MSVRAVLAVIAVVAFGPVASGCGDDGGGDKLTLEEYFEKIDELDNEQQTASDRLNSEVEELGEDASPDDVADSFQKQVDLLEDFTDDLDDIDPPDEVQDAHDEVVSALRDAPAEFESLIDEFREADSIEEAFGAFEDSDFSAIEKADEGCRDLEAIAADNNIDVDLDCGEDE